MTTAITSHAQAVARAERLRTKATDFLQELTNAYNDGDYLTLGYGSWHEYCAAELDGRIALPRVKGDRVELVKALSEAGMSQRAVAEATGIARNTIAKYVNPPVAQIEPPQDDPETALHAVQLTDETKVSCKIDLTNPEGYTAQDVLLDPWIIRAILLESLTPTEVVMSVLRRQEGELGATEDELIIDALVVGLLTRTGRYISAFNPDIPLPDPHQEDRAMPVDPFWA